MPIFNQIVKGSGGGAAEQFGLPVSSWSKLDVDANGELQKATASGDLSFDGVVSIKQLGVVPDNWFYNNKGITSVNFPDLELVCVSSGSGNNFYQAFRSCTNITGTVGFPKLEKLGDYSDNKAVYGTFANMFQGCTSITGVDLSALKEIYGERAFYYGFNGCTGITGNLDLSSLEIVRATSGEGAFSYGFQGCTGITSVDMSSLTQIILPPSGSIGQAFAWMFQNCTGITSVDMSSLTTISTGRTTYSGTYTACMCMFDGCSSLATVDLSSLQTISGANCCSSMFQNCTSLTSIDLSSLTTINGSYFAACNYMFSGCTNLASANLSGLQQIGGDGGCSRMFQNCTSLTSMNFASLTSVKGGSYMFSGCTSLTSVSFPALTVAGAITDFNWFSGVDGCTLHFPSNLQSTIEAKSAYPNFGGTNTTVLFDLPSTES